MWDNTKWDSIKWDKEKISSMSPDKNKKNIFFVFSIKITLVGRDNSFITQLTIWIIEGLYRQILIILPPHKYKKDLHTPLR